MQGVQPGRGQVCEMSHAGTVVMGECQIATTVWLGHGGIREREIPDMQFVNARVHRMLWCRRDEVRPAIRLQFGRP